MNINRFDQVAKSFAHRISRRRAFAAGGAGLGAVIVNRLSAAHAKDATPDVNATPVSADDIEVLFVQTFSSGALVPDPATEGAFTLTLEDGTGQTVYFSDRPDRVAGTLTDAQFLDGRAFDPADPPNAAIVAQTPDGEDILIVELVEPTLAPASGTVTYTVRVLNGQPEGRVLADLASRQTDDTMADAFGPVTLFIDQLACLQDGAWCQSDTECCSGFCCQDPDCYPGCAL